MKTKVAALFLFAVMTNLNSAKSQLIPYNGWAREEEIFSEVLELTIKEIEEKTPFWFGEKKELKAEFARSLENGLNTNVEPTAQYWYEGPTIKFRSWLIDDLFRRHGKSLYKLDAETLMKDKVLGEIIWHETAHHLMNAVSEAEGLGIWYTPEYIEKLDNEHWLGVNIISEGTAEYVKSLKYPFKKKPDEKCFPSEKVTSPEIVVQQVAYEGGYWLVKPILEKHGRTGMVWMMRYPFVAKYDNMRQAALDYQETALIELMIQKKESENRK